MNTFTSQLGRGVMFVALAIASFGIYDSVVRPRVVGDAAQGQPSAMNGHCSVAGINLHGELFTYLPLGSASAGDQQGPPPNQTSSERILYFIQQANDDDGIKAIVLEVDSPGGAPVAGEEIATALRHSAKPTVGVIREQGTSAAYWAVTGAKHVIASRNSIVGSIGVTQSYVDNVGKNQKDGNHYVQLSVGKYKDAGDPNRPLSAEERQLFVRDLAIVHKNFIEDVAAHRDIPVADVEKIADGSTVLGDEAKRLHLIDEIGGEPEAEAYLQTMLGEKPAICWN